MTKYRTNLFDCFGTVLSGYVSSRNGCGAPGSARKQAPWIFGLLLTGAMGSVGLPASAASKARDGGDLDALYLDLHAHPELAFQDNERPNCLLTGSQRWGSRLLGRLAAPGSSRCFETARARWS